MQMFCGYCGFTGEMVFVHSHYQCPRCKNNIAPCCEGEVVNEANEEEQAMKTDKPTPKLSQNDAHIKDA